MAIPKSVQPNRIAESTAVFTWELSDEAMSQLNTLRDPNRGVEMSIQNHLKVIEAGA